MKQRLRHGGSFASPRHPPPTAPACPEKGPDRPSRAVPPLLYATPGVHPVEIADLATAATDL